MSEHDLFFPARLYTIGYQRLTVERLLELVDSFGIDLVIDVRRSAKSQRKEWTDHQLVGAIGRERYEHWPQLGNYPDPENPPKKPPGWCHDDIDRANQATLQIRAKLEKGQRVLLLCMEEDPETCHRMWVAAAIAPPEQREHLRESG